MIGGRERKAMKLRDKEIAKQRERENETTNDDYPPLDHTINHFSHPHPLIYTEADNRGFKCSSCSLKGFGKRFQCTLCNSFNLHRHCAQSPVTCLLRDSSSDVGLGVQMVTGSFAHPDHSLVPLFKDQGFRCSHCNDWGKGIGFHCETCNIDFHQICANHPTGLTTHLHQHELVLKLRPLRTRCDVCGITGPRNSRMYRCDRCSFYVHPGCCDWPLYILHPFHQTHPLVLKPRDGKVYRCYDCKTERVGYKYRCDACDVDFDPGCIWRKSSKVELDEETKEKYKSDEMVSLPLRNLTTPNNLSQSNSDDELTNPLAFGDALTLPALCCLAFTGHM